MIIYSTIIMKYNISVAMKTGSDESSDLALNLRKARMC